MFAHNHIIANFVIRTLKLPGMEQQKRNFFFTIKSCKIQKKKIVARLFKGKSLFRYFSK